jgi:hypothetical protein
MRQAAALVENKEVTGLVLVAKANVNAAGMT